MGLEPTHRNESQDVTPAEAGVHVREELDSRFRGNDVTFDEARNLAPPCISRAGFLAALRTATIHWLLRESMGESCVPGGGVNADRPGSIDNRQSSIGNLRPVSLSGEDIPHEEHER